MSFAHGPVLCYVGRGQYKTVGTTEYVGRTDRVTIPADFPTDLASVPRLFWALLPPDGVYEKAAVLHDYLCVRLGDQHETGDPAPITARGTDGLFRRVAREGGTGFITRWLLWTGVRWGAIANPARRAGWWRDSPAVVGISAVVLAVVLAVIYGLHETVSCLLTLA